MDPGLQRDVEHATVQCLDCAAIDAYREKWHTDEGHAALYKDKPCPCEHEVFYIDARRPIPPGEARRFRPVAERPVTT